MAIGNDVTLVGNVTRDPELRFTPGGMAVAQFGLAYNRKYTNRAGEQKDEASFFDVVCYGTLGENVSESLCRGDRVMVQGRLEQRSWETQDGDKRSKIEVIADEIGAGMRWATVEITKNVRRDGEAPAYHDDRLAAPANAGAPASGGFSRPVPTTAPAYDYDEEPFVMDVGDGDARYAAGQRRYQP